MKKLLTLFLTLILVLTASGCGKSSDKIVIYTCQEEERIQAMKAALAEKFPDLNVVVEQMGTGNLAAKIKSEGTGIEADIIIDLESSHMKNLKDLFRLSRMKNSLVRVKIDSLFLISVPIPISRRYWTSWMRNERY